MLRRAMVGFALSSPNFFPTDGGALNEELSPKAFFVRCVLHIVICNVVICKPICLRIGLTVIASIFLKTTSIVGWGYKKLLTYVGRRSLLKNTPLVGNIMNIHSLI